MINFIIYEDDKKWQDYYKKAILKVIDYKEEKYHILVIDQYTQNLKQKIDSLPGKNIFLLDMHVPGKTGLDFAKEIRDSGDWESLMIMITFHECLKDEGFKSKILMLDFISKKDFLEEKVIDAIRTALRIHADYQSFTFTYNNALYQLSYQDILYFEKDLNHNYTSVVTKTNTYKVKKSIKKIEEELFSVPYFFKTHQSCIVNLKNIERIDFTNNCIHFSSEKQTNLISRNKKKELKEKLIKKSDYDFV